MMKQVFALLAAAVLYAAVWPPAAIAGDGGVYVGPNPLPPGWERVDPAQWAPNKAATAAELIGALLTGPLETLDGNPDVKVHVWKNGETFRAAVKAINLPDDSISGEETVIAIKEGNQGWIVSEVWKRWACRRGDTAGKWTNKICP